ncbi:MAG: metal ABC transporter permease [Clostridiales bacterium]|jgi:zinc transport system permease protein|nr:metal ABC transporter permease [Clostridiales bacterium]
MFEILSGLLSYDFIRRSLLVGSLVSLCAALLGVTLVLKRYSMIGDGLSHVGFGALCISLAMNVSPLTVSVPIVIIAAFFLLRISENSKIKGDAAIALISSTSIALGVIITSLTNGLNTDVSSYLFGSVLAVDKNDVFLSVVLSVTVIIIYIIFYNKIFAVTFDESFAKATGTKTGIFNTLIALLTAVIIVVGMRIMGALLVSSLIIFPALTSMRVFKSFKSVVISSSVISLVCFFLGIAASFIIETPAGASVVIVNAAMFLLFTAAGLILKSGFNKAK